jgi:hypothetical protein
MNTTQIIILSLITAATFVKIIIIETFVEDEYSYRLEGFLSWIYKSLMLNAIALLLMYIF